MWFIKKKKKLGLVLGSGGARGLAHVGVIRSLVENEIPIDIVVGASSGALIGGLFAREGNVDFLEKIMREIEYKDLLEVLIDPAWGGALIKGDKTLKYFKRLFENIKIEDMKIPFAAVATNINTAETVVFSKGDLAIAVRASSSVPLVYEPVVREGQVLVDGGVSSPVPVEEANKMGADVVVAVNLDGIYFSGKNNKESASGKTMDILKDSYFALRYNLAKKEVVGADVVIEPKMRYISDFDFVRGKDAIEIGKKSTEIVIGKIKKLL